MKLLGFTGKMGSGKSTAIQCLREIQHEPVQVVKFAGTLYEIQELIYKKIEPVYKRPENFIKDRKLLQLIGTEWGRNSVSETIWLDLWKREVEYMSENYPGTILVSDDVRFDNEADLIRSMGGSVIQIVSDKQRTDTKAGIAGHASETGVDLNKIDYILENNGSIEDLKSSLFAFNHENGLW